MQRYPQGANVEVRRVMAAVCRQGSAYSFVHTGSGKLKLLKDGDVVLAPTGRPFILPNTPNRGSQWRRDVMRDLQKMNILPPTQEGAIRTATPPKKMRRSERLRLGRNKARTLALKSGFARLMATVPESEIVQAASDLAVNMDVTGARGFQVARARLSELMAGKTQDAPVLDVLEATLAKLSPIPKQEEVVPAAVSTKCKICGFEAKDLRGFRAHERSHMPPQPCPHCGEKFPIMGLGSHARWCKKRLTVVKAPVVNVEVEPVSEQQHRRPGIQLVDGGEPYDNTIKAPGLSEPMPIHKSGTGKGAYHVRVPNDLAEKLAQKGYVALEFVPVVDGIMCYPVLEQEKQPQPELPDWLK